MRPPPTGTSCATCPHLARVGEEALCTAGPTDTPVEARLLTTAWCEAHPRYIASQQRAAGRLRARYSALSVRSSP